MHKGMHHTSPPGDQGINAVQHTNDAGSFVLAALNQIASFVTRRSSLQPKTDYNPYDLRSRVIYIAGCRSGIHYNKTCKCNASEEGKDTQV